jgi:uncharacterized protein
MTLPAIQQIEALHRKYAVSQSGFELVYTHCQIVNDIAQQVIARNHLQVDADLVRVGCLLHDIGVYQLLDEHGRERPDLHYITHGIRGESILKDEGYPDPITRFPSHHTGLGLTVHDITSQKLPLPARSYEAETLAEELVMYADKFHSKDTPPCFNSYDWYLKHAARFGPDKVAKFEELAHRFGKPDLAPLVAKFGHAVREM